MQAPLIFILMLGRLARPSTFRKVRPWLGGRWRLERLLQAEVVDDQHRVGVSGGQPGGLIGPNTAD